MMVYSFKFTVVVVILVPSVDVVPPVWLNGFIRDNFGFKSNETDLPTRADDVPTIVDCVCTF